MADKNENFKETFAKRLKAARKMRGLTMEELSELTGGQVSKPNISKYESGKMMPSAAAHIALAKALELDYDYFFRPFTAEVKEIKYYRTEKMKKKEEGSLNEKIRDMVERQAELQRMLTEMKTFKNPACSINVENEDDVLKVVKRVKEAWRLGEGVLYNVVEMLEQHGIKVINLAGSETFVSASAMTKDGEPVIVINKNDTLEEKRFNAMRELGRTLMKFGAYISEETERFCDVFACEMLLSGNILKDIVPAHVKISHIELLRSIQTQYGISTCAIWQRLIDFGLVDAKEDAKFNKRMKNDSDFYDYVNESTYDGDERAYAMERKLREAVNKEIITREKFKEALRVMVTNLKDYGQGNDKKQ